MLQRAGRLVGDVELFSEERELFVARTAGGLVIDRSPWVCAAGALIEPAVDQVALADMLALPLLPAEVSRSLLKGVTRVPPWSRLRVQGGAVEVVSVRRPTVALDEALADSVARCRDALLTHVERLTADCDRVGVLCSGGLDSAVVAAAVTAARGEAPTLVTATGGLLSAVEQRRAALTATALSARHVVVGGPFSFDHGVLQELNRGAAWPTGGVFSGVWAELERRCRDEDLDIVLTGEGGNEVFSPGGAELLDHLSEGRLLGALASFGRWRGTDRVGFIDAIRDGWETSLLPVKAWRAGGGHPSDWYGAVVRGFPAALGRWRERLGAMRRAGFSWTEAHALARLDGLGVSAAMAADGSRFFVHPLASDDVRESFFRAPLTNRYAVLNGARDKHLLRLVARTMLSAAVTEGPKIGLANQVAVLHRGVGRERIEFSRSAQDWLGFRLDDEFARPGRLPSALSLDWTTAAATLAWAENAVREPAVA